MNEKNILSHSNSNSSSKVNNLASIETNTSIKTNNNNNSSNSNSNKREDDYYYKTYYTRDPNEIEIHEKIVQIKPPVSPRTTSFTSNTPIHHFNNNSNTPYFITNLNKKISHNSSNSIKSEISFILNSNNNNQSHDEKVKANYYLSSSPSSTSSSMSNSHLDNTNQGGPNKTDNLNYINEMDEINTLSSKGLVKNLCKKFSPEDMSSLSSAQTPTPSSTPSLPSSNSSYRNSNSKSKDNDIIKRNHEKFMQSNSKNNKKMNTSSVSLNILKNFELKKCQSVIFDVFDASSSNANTKTSLSNSNTQLNKLDSCYVDIPINYQKAVKSKSNNCLSNEAYDEADCDDSSPMKKSSFRGGGEEDVFENVDIKEKINKFTFMNEGAQLPLRLAKGSNKSISRTNNNSEASAYGGSCSNLSSTSLNKMRQANLNSIAGSSDDAASSSNDSANSTFSDSSDSNCNHKASLGGVLGLFESINFNSVKFDESYKKIKDGFVDLRNDNQLIERLLNDIRNKVKETLVTYHVDGYGYFDHDLADSEFEDKLSSSYRNSNNFENSTHHDSNKLLANPNPIEHITLIRHKF